MRRPSLRRTDDVANLAASSVVTGTAAA